MIDIDLLGLLKRGRALISNPAHWHQGNFARDINGKIISATHPEAASWCSVGAILAITASLDVGYYPMIHALNVAVEDLSGITKGILYFNDTCIHEGVLAVWDAAIATEYSSKYPTSKL